MVSEKAGRATKWQKGSNHRWNIKEVAQHKKKPLHVPAFTGCCDLLRSHLLQTIGHDTFMQERSGVMRVIDYHYTALKGDTIGHGRTAHTNANPKALCDVLTAIKAGCGYVYVLYLSRTLTAFALFNFQRFTCIAHLVSDEPRTRTLEIMWTASALHVCVA